MTIQELERFSPGGWFYDVHDQLKQHIYHRSEQAFAAGDAARDQVTTCEALQERQKAIQEFLLTALGGLPEDAPLEARTVGVVQGTGFQVEKVIFQSRPRDYITANLYLPAGIREPTGAVLFLCGHHREAKHVTEYQSVCQQLVSAGLVVLAQDPPGQGERLAYYEPGKDLSSVRWGTLEHDHSGAQLLPLGDCLARYFLHDALRGIDYLSSRPEVDLHRIGVTGNSGGGTQTCLVMMADPRIAAAVPATFIMSRQSYLYAGGAQDAEQIWPGFTAAGFDHEDVLLAMAPRPVRVLAVTSDFFPIEGARRTVSRCRRFWDLCGGSGGLDLVEDQSTHAYTPTLARAAASFFSRHLLGSEMPIPGNENVGSAPGSQLEGADQPISPFPPQQLWCTRSGQVRGELDGAVSIYEANQVRLAQVEQMRQALPLPQRQEMALQWLRSRVHANRRPCDLNPRFYSQCRLEDLEVKMALWWSQEGIMNAGYLFRHAPSGEDRLPVTLAVWDGGTHNLQPHLEWLRSACGKSRAVLVLDVSGSGGLEPNPLASTSREGFYGVLHKFSTDLIWLDDDLAALRTWDVLRAVEMLQQWPGLDPSEIHLYAHGRQGLYGRLAALLDPRICRVEAKGGMSSYAEWIRDREYNSRDIYSILLKGVLRYFDLPEMETLIAKG